MKEKANPGVVQIHIYVGDSGRPWAINLLIGVWQRAESVEPSACVHVGGGVQLARVRQGPQQSGLISAEVTRRETEA